MAELRCGEVTPRGQLIRLTRRLPVELAAQLLSVLDGGPALLRAEAARVLGAALDAATGAAQRPHYLVMEYVEGQSLAGLVKVADFGIAKLAA